MLVTSLVNNSSVEGIYQPPQPLRKEDFAHSLHTSIMLISMVAPLSLEQTCRIQFRLFYSASVISCNSYQSKIDQKAIGLQKLLF